MGSSKEVRQDDPQTSPSEKICTICKESLKLECFSPNGKYLRSSCKKCEAGRKAALSKAKPEKYREYARKSREKHGDVRRADARAYYATHKDRWIKYFNANKEHIVEVERIWQKNNPEKVKARKKRDYDKNRDKYVARSKEYYKNNKDKHAERTHSYYLEHTDAVKAKIAEWQKKNPEKVKAIRRNSSLSRRARVAGADGKVSSKDIEKLYRQQGGKCGICRKKVGKKYHFDHVMPLAGKGTNDISNGQILCPKCNLSKGAKHPDVVAAELGRLFI